MFKFDPTKIPDYALKVARILIKEGFDCYLVGGAVRDNLLNRQSLDFDFTTNALPDQLIELNDFPKAVQINKKFGTLKVIVGDGYNEQHGVEITTYRKEENYFGGRWPDKVEFGISLEEDLERREFTISALCIDMKQFLDLNKDGTYEDIEQVSRKIPDNIEIIDKFNGIQDLQNKIIRAVGDPVERFSEDGLRSMRAVRMASNLGFVIEEATYAAIKKCLHVTAKVSIERFRDEFLKLLYKSPKPSVGMRLLEDTGMLGIFIPELLEGRNVTQKLFHVHDVWNHSLEVLDKAEDRIKVPALFHDIGKPRCDTHDGHFYGHDQVGAEMTKEILTRLRFPSDEVKKYSKLVEAHMFYFPSEESEQKWSDSAVRRFMNRVGVENLEDLFALRIADATANPKTVWDPTEITRLQDRIAKVLAEDNALKITDLDITGYDLIDIGLEGKDIGNTLKRLLEAVLDDPKLNTKEQLLKLAQEFTNIPINSKT